MDAPKTNIPGGSGGAAGHAGHRLSLTEVQAQQNLQRVGPELRISDPILGEKLQKFADYFVAHMMQGRTDPGTFHLETILILGNDFRKKIDDFARPPNPNNFFFFFFCF